MSAGPALAVSGAILILTPVFDMLRKFGRLDDEVTAAWFSNLKIDEMIKIQVAVAVGFAMLQFGMFIIFKP